MFVTDIDYITQVIAKGICKRERYVTLKIIVQWNLSLKGTLNKHLFNEDVLCSPNHIELCTNLPLNEGHRSKQDSQLGPNGVRYREVPLYTGQPAGSQWCPL